RRCYLIRLDAKTSVPWKRSGFRHEDLKSWVRDNRPNLVRALLTISRAWYAEGKPPADVPTFGSFEAWSRTIGGMLQLAGITGFLSNLDALIADATSEDGEWVELLEALSAYFGEQPFLARDVVQLVKSEALDS